MNRKTANVKLTGRNAIVASRPAFWLAHGSQSRWMSVARRYQRTEAPLWSVRSDAVVEAKVSS